MSQNIGVAKLYCTHCRGRARRHPPATVTAIQLAQNGTSTPFKVTDHPITIRINCRSAIRAKMAAASAQKVLMVIARLPMAHEDVLIPRSQNGEGPARRPLPLSRGSGLT